MNLLQLNRHLDDAHKLSEETAASNDPLKPGLAWFKKNLDRARQFPTGPLSKLDIFVSEDQNDQISNKGTNKGPRTVSPKRNTALRATKASEEKVSRAHWIKPQGNDKCSFSECTKFLGPRNGIVNCRCCGKLYCSEHTMYQMKLNKNAKHDAAHGHWCRVCETCYESRPGYNDFEGITKDITFTFKRVREEKSRDRELESHRLQKRLMTLIRELTKIASDSGILSYGKMLGRQQVEHRVATWQDDNEVTRCPICEHKFTYSLRKHHCRVCGKVVCADSSTDCSREVILSALAEKLNMEFTASSTYGVRMCRDCKDTVFSKINFEEDVTGSLPPLLLTYQKLARVKNSIDVALPKFQMTLLALNDPENPPDKECLHVASEVRKKLLQSFGRYDALSREISTLKLSTPMEKKLQFQIYNAATQYLHDNMLPLKALPRVLKSAETSSVSSPTPELTSEASSVDPQAVQELQQQLVVMEEQKFMVQSMVNDAKSRRKFDEVIPLEQSISDLDLEISKLRDQLGSYAMT